MAKPETLPLQITHEVRDVCLCLHLQRAARVLARRYDDALRPLGLTNGQFSLLMAINRESVPTMGEVAALLGVDRTTLTAALKALERRRLVRSLQDRDDRRSRRLLLTAGGHALMVRALPLWREAQSQAERAMGDRSTSARLRDDLLRLGRPKT
ncbi:MAG: winged helix-turn-helix transcriptional regulator [Enhydrobacter sp.]|nr:MAG: winged helix-turn-helix transcriptional regulator [Enhydrobacter sp.]